MNKVYNLKSILLLLLACGVVLTFAFAQTNAGKEPIPSTDTLPLKEKKIQNLDEALAELEQGEREMKRAFKEVDRRQLEKEVKSSLKEMEKNMAQMKEDIAREMKEIDLQKIKLDVQKELKEITSEKFQKELQESLAKVDTEKIKADVEKAASIDLSKMKTELEAIGPEVEKAMREAQVSIEKARKEITSYKNLVAALEKDGLLQQVEGYKIEYRNEELTVNGKKVEKEKTLIYKAFLSDKKHFTLEKNKDGLKIENE